VGFAIPVVTHLASTETAKKSYSDDYRYERKNDPGMPLGFDVNARFCYFILVLHCCDDYCDERTNERTNNPLMLLGFDE